MILSSKIWKEKSEPLTWRHFAIAAYWFITVIPMFIFILCTFLADTGDTFFGKLRRWANPNSYAKSLIRNYDYTEGDD